MQLEQVVPWGRSMWEYAHMFDLDEAALSSLNILGVGDGPASFNAAMPALPRRVVSVDPVYVFAPHESPRRALAARGAVVCGVKPRRLSARDPAGALRVSEGRGPDAGGGRRVYDYMNNPPAPPVKSTPPPVAKVFPGVEVPTPVLMLSMIPT